MKKFWPICCTAVLLIAVLVGCGPNTDEVPSESLDVPSEAPSPSIAPEISEDELYQQFELAYDSCGSSASEADEQLVRELALLMVKAKADERIWPEDYETRYREWRVDTIAERAAERKTQYDEIISAQIVCDDFASAPYTRDGVTYAADGLTYAACLDLDHDGKEELLLIFAKTLQRGDNAYFYNALEVYGETQGSVQKMGEASLASDSEDILDGIIGPEQIYFDAIISDDEHIYICFSRLMYQLHGYEYYFFEDDTLQYLGQQSARMGSDESGYEWIEVNDMSYFSDPAPYTIQTPENRCPKLPEDIQRKNAFLECSEVWWAKYARLIDMDQDGTDELLLLVQNNNNNRYGEYVFKVYSWGRNGLQGKELEYTSVWNDYNIYREKTSKNIYVGGIEQGGARGETSTFCSLTDTLSFGYWQYSADFFLSFGEPTTPAEEMELAAAYEQEEREYNEYQANIARFELIENIEVYSGNVQGSDRMLETVNNVRQQLMER